MHVDIVEVVGTYVHIYILSSCALGLLRHLIQKKNKKNDVGQEVAAESH